LVRLSQAFQPRCEVRRLTGDRTCLTPPGSVEIADYDRTGGDPRERL
jgi:hypothetical protein